MAGSKGDFLILTFCLPASGGQNVRMRENKGRKGIGGDLLFPLKIA